VSEERSARDSTPLVRDLPADPDEAPVAPQRPPLVELAAAILVVGGALGVVGAIGAAENLPAGSEPFLALTLALNVGAVVVGILARFGRAWLVAVNYVAVLAFLDLMAAGSGGLSILLGAGEVIALVILLANKAWFDAKRRERKVQR
jgi:hypothetical protein